MLLLQINLMSWSRTKLLEINKTMIVTPCHGMKIMKHHNNLQTNIKHMKKHKQGQVTCKIVYKSIFTTTKKLEMKKILNVTFQIGVDNNKFNGLHDMHAQLLNWKL
jgi:hypothetical protein